MSKNMNSGEAKVKIDQGAKKRDGAVGNWPKVGNDQQKREISDRELSADVNLINPELDSLGSRG